MPIKAVFFDIDGTLVDSNDFHVLAWDEALRDHGHRFETDKIRTQIGKGADQLLPTLIPDIDPVTLQAIAKRHGELFRTRYLKQVRAFPCATELLEMLHVKGKRVLLASSADKPEVSHYVELLKVGSYLAGTVSNDDVKHSKPAGDIFAAALAQVFPMAPTETLAVGDTPYDVQSALRSQIKTIALRSGGFSAETLVGAGAPYLYASVKELFESIETTPLQD